MTPRGRAHARIRVRVSPVDPAEAIAYWTRRTGESFRYRALYIHSLPLHRQPGLGGLAPIALLRLVAALLLRPLNEGRSRSSAAFSPSAHMSPPPHCRTSRLRFSQISPLAPRCRNSVRWTAATISARRPSARSPARRGSRSPPPLHHTDREFLQRLRPFTFESDPATCRSASSVLWRMRPTPFALRYTASMETPPRRAICR